MRNGTINCATCSEEMGEMEGWYVDDGSARELCQKCYEEEVCSECCGNDNCEECHLPEQAKANMENRIPTGTMQDLLSANFCETRQDEEEEQEYRVLLDARNKRMRGPASQSLNPKTKREKYLELQHNGRQSRYTALTNPYGVTMTAAGPRFDL